MNMEKIKAALESAKEHTEILARVLTDEADNESMAALEEGRKKIDEALASIHGVTVLDKEVLRKFYETCVPVEPDHGMFKMGLISAYEYFAEMIGVPLVERVNTGPDRIACLKAREKTTGGTYFVAYTVDRSKHGRIEQICRATFMTDFKEFCPKILHGVIEEHYKGLFGEYDGNSNIEVTALAKIG